MSASHTQNHPRLSVLTISLNQAKFLKDTINSVYDQQYDNLEYVFIDGQSSDGTQDILKTYDDGIVLFKYNDNTTNIVDPILNLEVRLIYILLLLLVTISI